MLESSFRGLPPPDTVVPHAVWLESIRARLSSSTDHDARWLLECVTRRNCFGTAMNRTLSLDSTQRRRLNLLLHRRAQGTPVAYLTRRCAFWTFALTVVPGVFVPRFDTESLVETALSLLDDAPRSVLDLGTGTGAVALALAKERPRWNVRGVDASKLSVRTARENARSLNLRRTVFVRWNWFWPTTTRYDLVVVNPPYLGAGDPHLRTEIRFEPRAALVSRRRGWSDLLYLCGRARSWLKAGGWLVVEHGCRQGIRVRRMLSRRGFVRVGGARDLRGRDRCSFGQRIF